MSNSDKMSVADRSSSHSDDETTGEYVYDSPYLEMRLRMKLTGCANPSEEVWARALRDLLDQLGYD